MNGQKLLISYAGRKFLKLELYLHEFKKISFKTYTPIIQ